MTLHLQQLSLVDFRSYPSLELDLPPERVAFIGPNGVGKTNILEAVAWLATMASFRGVPAAALVRDHSERAQLRGVLSVRERPTVIDADIAVKGAARVTINGTRLARSRDLLGHVRVTVFSPDDLQLVKGGPAERRAFVDELLVAVNPRNDRVVSEFDRLLRHRNALLRQAGGRLSAEISSSLEVWNTKLSNVADELGRLRDDVITRLAPGVDRAYREIAGANETVTVAYRAEWRTTGLYRALAEAHHDDVRRATTTVGPHRDELEVAIDGRPARTHCSQGEQRSLALALRLAQHRLVQADIGMTPVLLLDDVLSELDPQRCAALLRHLPVGQALVTSASELPAGAGIDVVYDVLPGAVARRGRS